MQEESDILTSEEFANIESEGLALLTRQLQVKSYHSLLDSYHHSYRRLKHPQSFLMTMTITASTLNINQSPQMKIREQ